MESHCFQKASADPPSTTADTALRQKGVMNLLSHKSCNCKVSAGWSPAKNINTGRVQTQSWRFGQWAVALWMGSVVRITKYIRTMETDKDSLLLGNKAKTSTISCKSCHSTLWLYLLATGKMSHLPKTFYVVAEKSLLLPYVKFRISVVL